MCNVVNMVDMCPSVEEWLATIALEFKVINQMINQSINQSINVQYVIRMYHSAAM